MTPLQITSAAVGLLVAFVTLAGSVYSLVDQEREARRNSHDRTLAQLARVEDQTTLEIHRLQDDIKRFCK